MLLVACNSILPLSHIYNILERIPLQILNFHEEIKDEKHDLLKRLALMCFRLCKIPFTHHAAQILKLEMQSLNWCFHGNRIPGSAIV
jgi:hypothetical protein